MHTPTRRQFVAAAGALSLSAVAGRTHADDGFPAARTEHDHIRSLAEGAPLAMQFQGSTADQCRAWQAEFAAKLRELLGPHAPPKEWKTTRRTVELEDHVRHELLLEAQGHPPLPLYLLTPREPKERKLPGVLAIHGHGDFGHHPVAGRDDLPGVTAAIEGSNYDYGRQLARRGFVVACPCLTPFGDRLASRDAYGGNDPCAVTFVRMQLLGKVLIAENLRDCLWALELLARDDRVDAERLGCVGLSYGGRMTMLTSALEPRIRVACPSGALNVMQERVAQRYGCGAQVIPGLLKYGDVPEISSLIAPHHCVWEAGSRDGLIKADWADRALGRMRRAYDALGAGDRLLVDRFEGGHRWNGEVAFRVLDEVLKA